MVGLYSLEMATDLELEPKPCHVIAFEDAGDCKNLCYIIQAHMDMLGNGHAFVVPRPPKVRSLFVSILLLSIEHHVIVIVGDGHGGNLMLSFHFSSLSKLCILSIAFRKPLCFSAFGCFCCLLGLSSLLGPF